MSYYFSVKAKTKAEARDKVAAELANVVTSQPVHVADRQAAQDAANIFIAMLGDPRDGECVNVTVSGSLGWRDTNIFTAASVSVQASLAPNV